MRGASGVLASSALVLLTAQACQEKLPSGEPVRSTPTATPPATEAPAHVTPSDPAPSDAGTLALEDAEAVTPPPTSGDAGALPAIIPPLEQVQETCVLAMGRPVFFTQSATPGGGGFTGGGNVYRVYEDEAAFRTLLGLGRLGSVDPQRQRLVRIKIMDRPSSTVTAVVDRGDAVVISVDVPVYCGGARPYSPVIDVVLPRSNKPIKVQSCSHGSCSGMPLP
ncbi:MAG: hypothetical protein AB7K71_30420 [Polyangiaceae bacterium]